MTDGKRHTPDAILGEDDQVIGTTTVRRLPASACLATVAQWGFTGEQPGWRSIDMPVFLDSSQRNDRGRFSIIGLNPFVVLEEDEGITRENGREVNDSFLHRLQYYNTILAQPNPTHLPLLGGALGYFSYDYGRHFEHISTQHVKEEHLPEARFVFYDNLIIEDHLTGETVLTAQGRKEHAFLSLNRLEHMILEAIGSTEHVQQRKRCCTSHDTLPLREVCGTFQCSQAEYEGAVRDIQAEIGEGNAYIINMTQNLTFDSECDPYVVYNCLRTHNPAPFSAYLSYPEASISCSSPERFLSLCGDIVETCPIKGTRARGSSHSEDKRLREELIHSEKDKRELLMIVDLERNDLNRVCEPGSVNVSNHCALEAFATVFHLSSTVRGRLRPDKSLSDLIAATFPGGSISGAPKISAMQLIDRLERGRRGLYTGSIGYVSNDGNAEFNIVIRTIVQEGRRCRVGVGGGITSQSDPHEEYLETLHKARALREALARAEQLSTKRR